MAINIEVKSILTFDDDDIEEFVNLVKNEGYYPHEAYEEIIFSKGSSDWLVWHNMEEEMLKELEVYI